MRFPKHELNIDTYLDRIKNLLSDKECHIFIDTNVISQLYRLNSEARLDFYKWVDDCGDRFHIPSWSIHEYSKHVTTQRTQEYISELITISKSINTLDNITAFIKGYVGDSLLKDSAYDGRKDDLIRDYETSIECIKQIAKIVNVSGKTKEHGKGVHNEISARLSKYAIDSNIYNILKDVNSEYELRYSGQVPPGFKDSGKTDNSVGDLVIWKEILNYCKYHNVTKDKAKVILISRDEKADMVYNPTIQTRSSHRGNVNAEDKIAIAHESLVYEFKTITGSEEFYLINFEIFSKSISREYIELVKSFQYTTQQEFNESMQELANSKNENVISQNNDCIEESISMGIIVAPALESDEAITEEPKTNEVKSDKDYSGTAKSDEQYEFGEGCVDEFSEELKSYNWYKQNPAIDELNQRDLSKIDNTPLNRDSFFVLGRNILQAAIGTSGSAMHFAENIAVKIAKWDKIAQKAFVDGYLFEMFFDSKGAIRQNGFKTYLFDDTMANIGNLVIHNQFDFINNKLSKKNNGRFIPEIGLGKDYTFEFEFTKEEDDTYSTSNIKINNVNVSETFKRGYGNDIFEYISRIKNALSEYYAIPVANIIVKETPKYITVVHYIKKMSFDDSLPF